MQRSHVLQQSSPGPMGSTSKRQYARVSGSHILNLGQLGQLHLILPGGVTGTALVQLAVLERRLHGLLGSFQILTHGAHHAGGAGDLLEQRLVLVKGLKRLCLQGSEQRPRAIQACRARTAMDGLTFVALPPNVLMPLGMLVPGALHNLRQLGQPKPLLLPELMLLRRPLMHIAGPSSTASQRKQSLHDQKTRSRNVRWCRPLQPR
mmetsp:Transcript_6146/g.14735  ORF Transcript_6146/g.14735 Transcript_6146/m.14735 type:complete len:206 (+) Transcript_6146:679-1296(+)